MTSAALIDDFATAAAALRTAMQGADLSAIEQAMAQFRTALEAVQSVGAWTADPALKARVADIRAELESSRMLACLLGDIAGQLHQAKAHRNPDSPQPLYRPGR
jgi:hypothetical protein